MALRGMASAPGERLSLFSSMAARSEESSNKATAESRPRLPMPRISMVSWLSDTLRDGRIDTRDDLSAKIRAGGAAGKNVQHLIGGPQPRHTDTQIIAGDRGGPIGRRSSIRVAEGQHAHAATGLGGAKGGASCFSAGAQLAGAPLDDGGGDFFGEMLGLSARTLGKRKDVKVGERRVFDERKRPQVVGFGFTGEAGDDIGANGGVGEALANQFNARGVVCGAVPAVHRRQDAIRTGLERNVEVVRDAIGGGKRLDQVARNVHRFDRTDAQSQERSFVEDSAEEISEFDAGTEIEAIAAQIDAAENDFVDARGAEAIDFTKNSFGREATAASAHKGDDAIGAAMIAAILNLQDGTRVAIFIAKHRHAGKIGERALLEDVSGKNLCRAVSQGESFAVKARQR